MAAEAKESVKRTAPLESDGTKSGEADAIVRRSARTTKGQIGKFMEDNYVMRLDGTSNSLGGGWKPNKFFLHLVAISTCIAVWGTVSAQQPDAGMLAMLACITFFGSVSAMNITGCDCSQPWLTGVIDLSDMLDCKYQEANARHQAH